MRKKLLTVGLAVLMAISSTSCKSSEKTQTAKEDTYKNYKQYNTSFGLKYKIPNDWNKTDTSTSTDLTFSKDDDTITHGLIGVYYYEFDGDIIQKENFRSLVSNIKDGENYNGKFHSESSTINGVKVNFFSYELDINGDAYFMKGIVFNCGNGYCILDFIYPTNKDYGKLFDNIANSISVNTSAIVTATEKPNETEASVSATEEPTTTEVTTEATTEKTTEVYAPTTGEENALNKAFDYLDYDAFSKSGLIKQLKYEGFTTKEAKYAANNCNANWKDQAYKKATSYLESQSFSKSGLIKQLEYEGFTNSQAKYGANKAYK
ncbi:Ltp family lipoprotein [Anaerostipes faecalis]|uniref:Ltp family lipoprotein n=1 Tax=Anaerostipes faecalis TaxID=2738446 RepID=UPI003F06C81B